MKNRFKKLLSEYINNSIDSISKLDYSCSSSIIEAAELIISSLKKNNKLLICGNGGSAADSQHIAAELVGRYMRNRKPLASIALSTDTSVITAISNDLSFNEIFSRQIESIGNEGDILYAISTSSKSKNILAALKMAKSLNIKSIGVTGIDNSGFMDLCDVSIKVPATRPDRIQEMHIAIGQIICEILETELC